MNTLRMISVFLAPNQYLSAMSVNYKMRCQHARNVKKLSFIWNLRCNALALMVSIKTLTPRFLSASFVQKIVLNAQHMINAPNAKIRRQISCSKESAIHWCA